MHSCANVNTYDSAAPPGEKAAQLCDALGCLVPHESRLGSALLLLAKRFLPNRFIRRAPSFGMGRARSLRMSQISTSLAAASLLALSALAGCEAVANDAEGQPDASISGDASQAGAEDAAPNREPDGGDVPVASNYQPCEPTHTPSNYQEGIAAGGFVCLADGVYTEAISIPDNAHVKSATLFGARFVGGGDARSIIQQGGNNSIVQGIHASHPTGANASSCTAAGTNNQFLDMACIGAGVHRYAITLNIGGSDNVLQNITVGGFESRYLAACYLGDNITVRNLLGIWSGGPSEDNGGASEPTAVITNYSCSDMLWENIAAIDPAYSYVPYGGIIKLATVFDEANHRVRYNNIIVRADPAVAQDRSFRRAIEADSKNTTGGRSTEVSVNNLFVRDMGVAASVKDTYDFTMTKCTLVDVASGAGQVGFGSSAIALECDGTTTIDAMFPWPNEGLVKQALCEERESRWCSFDGTLKEYVLN